jgi:mannose-6-phosphate isomerase-like protein (cupin superfamily)
MLSSHDFSENFPPSVNSSDCRKENRSMPTDWLVTVADARAGLPAAPAQQFREVLVQGTARIGFYAPRRTDPQGPHQRDELYVVWRGAGRFERAGESRAFGPGDVIFVPAGMAHRFVDFDDDFAAWVIFYGPVGGEVAVASPG